MGVALAASTIRFFTLVCVGAALGRSLAVSHTSLTGRPHCSGERLR